jgi:nucleoside-diphosphate-sugar epimerase
MTDPILITGGTGTLGRAVTQLLLDGCSRHGCAVT